MWCALLPVCSFDLDVTEYIFEFWVLSSSKGAPGVHDHNKLFYQHLERNLAIPIKKMGMLCEQEPEWFMNLLKLCDNLLKSCENVFVPRLYDNVLIR